MAKAYRNFAGAINTTPPKEQAHPLEVPNSDGGFVFPVDCWVQLQRFLILGSSGGSYYATEKDMTKENAAVIKECIEQDAIRTLETIRDISVAGRAVKNAPAVFALALCASYKGDNMKTSAGVRSLALDYMPLICRTGTDLFLFTDLCNQMRGWGKTLKNGISDWYLSKSPEDLAYQVVKYRNRENWTHRDVLRKCHPIAKGQINAILRWIVDRDNVNEPNRSIKRKNGKPITYPKVADADLPDIILAFQDAQNPQVSEAELVKLITDYRLPREAIPTQWLNSVAVWDALLDHMPMTAMIRNLGKMTSIGLLAPLADANKKVLSKLLSSKSIMQSKVHPMTFFLAHNQYATGHGLKGSLSWKPITQIVDALDSAFYTAFDNVEPTNKGLILALDRSGSMQHVIADTNISARKAAAAMALVTASAEPNTVFLGVARTAVLLDISPNMRLSQAVAEIEKHLEAENTNLSLPMEWAEKEKVHADGIILYTDNQHNAGTQHPFQAVKKYRKWAERATRFGVVSMVPNSYDIGLPDDAGSMKFVGFDTSTPQMISEFMKGNI